MKRDFFAEVLAKIVNFQKAESGMPSHEIANSLTLEWPWQRYILKTH